MEPQTARLSNNENKEKSVFLSMHDMLEELDHSVLQTPK